MREGPGHTGRPSFSACANGARRNHGCGANGTGNLWRTTGDIDDKWEGKFDYKLGMMNIVDLNEPLYPYAGPGHWNDPDMLEIGNGGLTVEEYRTHFSLWAMMAAPLIAGNDVAHMTADIRSILLNREVIAVDQDPLGRQGRRVRTEGRPGGLVRENSPVATAPLLFAQPWQDACLHQCPNGMNSATPIRSLRMCGTCGKAKIWVWRKAASLRTRYRRTASS